MSLSKKNSRRLQNLITSTAENPEALKKALKPGILGKIGFLFSTGTLFDAIAIGWNFWRGNITAQDLVQSNELYECLNTNSEKMSKVLKTCQPEIDELSGGATKGIELGDVARKVLYIAKTDSTRFQSLVNLGHGVYTKNIQAGDILNHPLIYQFLSDNSTAVSEIIKALEPKLETLSKGATKGVPLAQIIRQTLANPDGVKKLQALGEAGLIYGQNPKYFDNLLRVVERFSDLAKDQPSLVQLFKDHEKAVGQCVHTIFSAEVNPEQNVTEYLQLEKFYGIKTQFLIGLIPELLKNPEETALLCHNFTESKNDINAWVKTLEAISSNPDLKGFLQTPAGSKQIGEIATSILQWDMNYAAINQALLDNKFPQFAKQQDYTDLCQMLGQVLAVAVSDQTSCQKIAAAYNSPKGLMAATNEALIMLGKNPKLLEIVSESAKTSPYLANYLKQCGITDLTAVTTIIEAVTTIIEAAPQGTVNLVSNLSDIASGIAAVPSATIAAAKSLVGVSTNEPQSDSSGKVYRGMWAIPNAITSGLQVGYNLTASATYAVTNTPLANAYSYAHQSVAQKFQWAGSVVSSASQLAYASNFTQDKKLNESDTRIIDAVSRHISAAICPEEKKHNPEFAKYHTQIIAASLNNALGALQEADAIKIADYKDQENLLASHLATHFNDKLTFQPSYWYSFGTSLTLPIKVKNDKQLINTIQDVVLSNQRASVYGLSGAEMMTIQTIASELGSQLVAETTGGNKTIYSGPYCRNSLRGPNQAG